MYEGRWERFTVCTASFPPSVRSTGVARELLIDQLTHTHILPNTVEEEEEEEEKEEAAAAEGSAEAKIKMKKRTTAAL